MPIPTDATASRRRFLKFLAASPVLAMGIPRSIEEFLGVDGQSAGGSSADGASLQ